MLATTAQLAWRAISPVCSVTVSLPYWNVFECVVTRLSLGWLAAGKTRWRQRARFVVSDRSAAQAETLDQILVTSRILAVQVVEQLAALIDHPEQTPSGMVIVLVFLEVFGQVGDSRGQQCNLYFR